MFNNKKIITFTGLTLFAIATVTHCTQNKQIKNTRSINTSKLLKKNEKILWNTLNKTTLNKKIDNKMLITHAKTIENLITHNPTILTNKQKNKTPAEFALINCYHQISKIFYTTTKIEDYSPSYPITKKNTEQWATKYGEKLAFEVIHALKNWNESKNKSKSIENVGLDNKIFNITLNKISPEQAIDFFYGTCILTKKDTKEAYQDACIRFGCEPRNDVLSIEICQLITNENVRQQGLGRALLSMVIAIAQHLKYKKTHLHLLAVTNKQLFPILLNYYKSFGFIPRNSPSSVGYLDLYLNKEGKILKKFELGDWTEKELKA